MLILRIEPDSVCNYFDAEKQWTECKWICHSFLLICLSVHIFNLHLQGIQGIWKTSPAQLV